MSTQSASPNNGPVTAQNAGTTDIPTLMANATRTFRGLPAAIMELGTVFESAGEEIALPDPELFAQLNGQNPAANAESAALLDKIRSSRRTD